MKIPEQFGSNHALIDAKETLFGIELEIEAIDRNQIWTGISPYIEVKEDHSLRNSGREFITPPRNLKTTLEFFKNVHSCVKFLNPLEKFSERTSIHVHVNCQNLEVGQVRQVVLLYALFEECFFRMVESSRRDNIHCVPITDTYLPVYFRQSLSTQVSKWSKYTALNLLPLKSLGTIEFRHMHGHDDSLLLQDWLMSIERLLTLSKSFPLSVETLTDENISSWFSFIFGDTVFWKNSPATLNSLTENTIINVKMGFI